MTKLKILSAGLLAAAMLATPALAREAASTPRHFARDSYAGDQTEIYQGSVVCHPAPRVGAFATAPWSDTNIPCEPETGSY